jgi:hypothetical protein
MSEIVQKYETMYNAIKQDDGEPRASYRKRLAAITDCFKDELEHETFGSNCQTISRNKLDRLWDIAWSNGHSSGYNEVYLYYIEMSDLIDPNY